MDGILNSSVVLLHVLPVFVFHHLKNEIWNFYRILTLATSGREWADGTQHAK